MQGNSPFRMALSIAGVLAPFALGLAAIGIFYSNLSCGEIGVFSTWNACTWHIHGQSYSNVSMILIVGMICHNLVIGIGTSLFLIELFNFNGHHNGHKKAKVFLRFAFLLILCSFGVQFLMVIWMTNSAQIAENWPGILSLVGSRQGESGVLHDLRLVEVTDYMVIILFAMFLVGDILFYFGCKAIHQHDSCTADSREKARRKRGFLLLLIFLVDVPVLVGASTVVGAIWRLDAISKDQGDFGSHITDLSEMGRNGLIEHNIIDAAGRGDTPEVRSERTDKVAYINAKMLENYLLGLLAGALFFQVLYSQIVLLALNARERLRDHRAQVAGMT
jgi:hypothetical protein